MWLGRDFVLITWSITYRLMHAFFHIRTVIIQRVRYRPEGFRLRVDISQGMITVLIWKKAQFWYGKRHALIYLSHTNVFQHWIKKNKINFTHTHQTMSDWYRFRDDNSPDMEKGMHCSIYKGAWYHVVLFIKRLDIMLSEFCPDIRPGADIAVALWCLHMGKIDVITYKYVISIIYRNKINIKN
jgi:hypothetical protein